MALAGTPAVQPLTPLPGGGVLVLGVPFPDLHRAHGACLEALGATRSLGARMRLLSAIVSIRGALGDPS